MFNNIGTLEVAIVALVILMLFGASRLPIFTRGLVEAKKEFKDAFKDDENEEKNAKNSSK